MIWTKRSGINNAASYDRGVAFSGLRKTIRRRRIEDPVVMRLVALRPSAARIAAGDCRAILPRGRRAVWRERPGRPRRLDAKNWCKWESDSHKTPRDFDLVATVWDGPVLSEPLRRRYGVNLGVRQCRRLFRDRGFRLRRRRPSFAVASVFRWWRRGTRVGRL